jgi:hypothetical protein
VFLALGRGPGAGQREDIHGFAALGGLGARRDVGLLLSTSSARESHEWSEFQAGIFSHEVRSGLLGAADANHDGHVSYREIAAFIERANALVPNDKFRPDVYVKEPAGTAALIDLRPGLRRRMELDGDHPGHYSLEDARGVRLADFHSAQGQTLSLIRQAGGGSLFLRRAGETTEYAVDGSVDVLRFQDLQPQPSTAQPRGAAHEAFSLLFSLPFSQQVVDDYVVRAPALIAPASEVSDVERQSTLRRTAAFTLLGAGAGAAAGGTWLMLSALALQHAPANSQADVVHANQGIERRNTWSRVCYGAGAAAVGAGALLLLWPRITGSLTGSRLPPLAIGVAPGGAGIDASVSF